MAGETEDVTTVRLLCSKLVPATSKQDSTSLQWLIGSPFFPPYTIASTILCTHFDSSSLSSPAVLEEAEDLRSLIIRGFRVIGALVSGVDGDPRRIASEAIDCAIRLNKCLDLTGVENTEGLDLVGGVLNSGSGEARFFVRKGNDLVDVLSVSFEHEPEQYVWDRGCLLRCELPIELPVYYRASKSSDAEQMHLRAHEALLAKLKDPSVTFIMESSHKDVAESALPIVIRGADLDFTTCHSYAKPLDDFSQATGAKYLPCSHFCLTKKNASTASVENADMIEVAIMINSSGGSPNMDAPVAQFCPASEEVKLWNVDFKLEVICYAAKYLPLKYAIAELLIPALIDQLNSMKRLISPCLLKQLIQLRPYHFSPPGILHPITVIYDLTYGEMESAQVEMRRSLHRRLGLPSDRPLLRAANALNFSKSCNRVKGSLKRGTPLLRDVHLGIPSSGVSGGTVSLVQGSYEYHHYLQDGFDDSGWGCAYRSLQTIISWFRLQLYTAVDVPLHREIQHALVEIGDKDPSFIGSREWIGAIELSYVLDKLLGVTCKVMNVRSGSELPEKCRELALHFEYQGTPIMIGGGVLAYTLLGVDYNEVSGDCAFLILDPHYTGGEDLKKIVNGGWCGWKQAIDSKGKKFFLDDKFYNLLLPQRPNMV